MAAGLPQTGFAKNDPEEVAINRIRHGGAVTPCYFAVTDGGLHGVRTRNHSCEGSVMTFSLRRRVGATIATTGVVVLSALASLAPAASASTRPPGATPEAKAEAVIQPSLVYIAIEAAGV